MKTYKDMLEKSWHREYHERMWEKNEGNIEKTLEGHLDGDGCLKGYVEVDIYLPGPKGFNNWKVDSFMRHMYLTLKAHGYPVVLVNLAGMVGVRENPSFHYEVNIHFEDGETPWW